MREVDPSLPDTNERDISKFIEYALSISDGFLGGNLIIAAGVYEIEGIQYDLKQPIHCIDSVAAVDMIEAVKDDETKEVASLAAIKNEEVKKLVAENNKILYLILKQQLENRKITDLKAPRDLKPRERYIPSQIYPVTLDDGSKIYAYPMQPICIVDRCSGSLNKQGLVLEMIGKLVKKEGKRNIHERLRITFTEDTIELTPQPGRVFLIGEPSRSDQHEIATLRARNGIYKLKSPIEFYSNGTIKLVILPQNLFQGETLSDYLKNHRDKLSIVALLSLSLALLDELHWFMRKNILHGNITQENIMVREENGKYLAHLTDLSLIYNKNLVDETYLYERGAWVSNRSSYMPLRLSSFFTSDPLSMLYCVVSLFTPQGHKLKLDNKLFNSLFKDMNDLRDEDKIKLGQVLLQGIKQSKTSYEVRDEIFNLHCKYASGVAQALNNTEALRELVNRKNLGMIVSPELINRFCGLVNFYQDATNFIKDKLIESNPLYKKMKDIIIKLQLEPTWRDAPLHAIIYIYYQKLQEQVYKIVQPLAVEDLFADLQSRINLIESPIMLEADLFVLQFLTILADYQAGGDNHLTLFQRASDYVWGYETGQQRAQRIINSLLLAANKTSDHKSKRSNMLKIIHESFSNDIGNKFKEKCELIMGKLSMEELAERAHTLRNASERFQKQTATVDTEPASLPMTAERRLSR